MNTDKKERILGLFFGIIGIIAAVLEMVFSGVEPASVCGMIKDISGMAVVIIMAVLLYAPKPKQKVDFDSQFKNSMAVLEIKYSPILKEKPHDSELGKNVLYYYQINNNIKALSDSSVDKKTFSKLFTYKVENGKTVLEFEVKKTVFQGRSQSSDTKNDDNVLWNLKCKEIVDHIMQKSERYKNPDEKFTFTQKNATINSNDKANVGCVQFEFDRILGDEITDVDNLSIMIDGIIFIFVVENSK